MKIPTAHQYARLAAKAAEEKLGENIVAIDVRGHSSVTDCFMFISGTSFVHVGALEDSVRKKLKEGGANLIRTDGKKGHLWRVLDYGFLLIHIMEKQTREFYAIERLWNLGKKIPLARLKSRSPKTKKKSTKRKKAKK